MSAAGASLEDLAQSPALLEVAVAIMRYPGSTGNDLLANSIGTNAGSNKRHLERLTELRYLTRKDTKRRGKPATVFEVRDAAAAAAIRDAEDRLNIGRLAPGIRLL